MKHYEVEDAEGRSLVKVPKGKTLSGLGYPPEVCVSAIEVGAPKVDRAHEQACRMVGAMTVAQIEALVDARVAAALEARGL